MGRLSVNLRHLSARNPRVFVQRLAQIVDDVPEIDNSSRIAIRMRFKHGVSRLLELLTKSAQRSSRLSFLDLPVEVRQTVYRFVFQDLRLKPITSLPSHTSRRLPQYYWPQGRRCTRPHCCTHPRKILKERKLKPQPPEQPENIRVRDCQPLLTISKELHQEIYEALLRNATIVLDSYDGLRYVNTSKYAGQTIRRLHIRTNPCYQNWCVQPQIHEFLDFLRNLTDLTLSFESGNVYIRDPLGLGRPHVVIGCDGRLDDENDKTDLQSIVDKIVMRSSGWRVPQHPSVRSTLQDMAEEAIRGGGNIAVKVEIRLLVKAKEERFGVRGFMTRERYLDPIGYMRFGEDVLRFEAEGKRYDIPQMI